MAAPEPDPLLTLPEVASILRVGVGTIKRWTYSGTLPTVKIGRLRRVSRRQLDAWLERLEREGSVPPAWPHSRDRAALAAARKAAR